MRILSICLLCDRLGLGGAETHIVTLAEALAEMGHRVTVVSSGGALVSTLKKAKHICMPLDKKRFLPFALFALWRLLRRERFDVVHAHTRYSAALARLLAKERLATTAHWVFDTAFPKRLLSFWGKNTLAVSEDIRTYLVENYGLCRDAVRLTVNGVNSEHFYPEKKNAPRCRIVYVSRLSPDRAAAAFSLLEAVALLPPQSFSLCIVGEGASFPLLQKEAEKLVKKDPGYDIMLTGGKSDVAPYLRDADIFVGVSRAALEAMASGCAVILAGNEGYLSVFSPQSAQRAEKTNFCCREERPTDAAALYKDLSYLISLKRETLWRMGEENRAYVKEKYSAARMASDALAVYERICRQRTVLCGYYGFRNVGDTLLCRALCASLSSHGYRKIYLLSTKRLSVRAFVTILRGYDFFLGGGNLLQDATSSRSLSFYLFFCRLAQKRGCRIFLPSTGIGPLSSHGETRVKAVLSYAEGIFCRTRGDALRARALGGEKVFLTADAALSLPFPKKKKGKKILLAFRAPAPEKEAAVLAFVLRLSRTYGVRQLVIFPLHPKDVPFAKRLSKLTKVPLIRGSADIFLSLLNECACVFGTRLHLGICALGAHVPFFLHEGEEKCRFFVSDVRALSPADTFCSTFSFSAPPPSLPSAHGMEEAHALLLSRFERIQ